MTYNILLFPSVFHWCEVSNFEYVRDTLINFAYEEKEKYPESLIKSNGGGWHSPDNIYSTYDNPLHHIVKSALTTFFANSEIFVENVDFAISALWVNINKKGNFHYNHLHPNSDFSGVLWIKVPDENSEIGFQSPNNYNQWRSTQIYKSDFRDTIGLEPSWSFTPSEGNMLLFPSSIMHKVLPNESEEDRIAASFNLSVGNK